MAHEKNHDYHILPPSAWPLLGALACFVLLCTLLPRCNVLRYDRWLPLHLLRHVRLVG